MQKKLLLIPVLIIMLASLFVATPVTSSPETVVGIDPIPTTAAVGATFDVDVTVADVTNLTGWEFNMTFDPTVLNGVTVTEGPFLYDFALSAGVFSLFLFNPDIDLDNINGRIHAACGLWPLPTPPDGADGSGVLATVTFSVVSKGMSDLQFPLDQTLLRTFDPDDPVEPIEILHTAKDGFFQYPIGDVDGDGDVDGFDLTRMCGAYGLTPSDLGWDEPCDINKDDIIDGFDLTPACGNYGMNP